MDHGDLLEGERARLEARITELEHSHAGIVDASVGTTDDEHDPEGQTVAVEREQVAGLLREARSQLDEVAAALARVAAGSYGVCAQCGEPIAPARLEARPSTAHCISCASAPALWRQ